MLCFTALYQLFLTMLGMIIKAEVCVNLQKLKTEGVT